jgi:SAM-dependent methyltransferase
MKHGPPSQQYAGRAEEGRAWPKGAAPPSPRWRSFDARATSYDRWYETPLGAFADRVEREAIFGLLRPQSGERILDIGCGTGRYALELSRLGARAVAVDPSSGMLAAARVERTAPGGPAYLRAVGERLPFVSAAFDAVIGVTTLEFAEDVDSMLAEAVRVTKSGGRLVVGVLNRRGLWAARRKKSRSPLWADARFFGWGELRARLEAYGSVRGRRALFVPPQLGWLPRPLLGLLEALGGRLARPWGAFIAMRLDIGR